MSHTPERITPRFACPRIGFARRGLLALCATLALCPAAPAQDAAQPSAGAAADRVADFQQMWQEVQDHYVYLDGKAASWADTRRRYEPLLAGADTLDAWTSLLAGALAELGDFHIEVSPRPHDDWRPVPTCAMLWAQWRHGAARVTGVQPGSNAARAGILPGDVILTVDGRAPLATTPADRPPAPPDHWLLQQLAGRRDSALELVLRTPSRATRTVTLATDCRVDRPEAPVTAQRTAHGFGLLRFNNSLGNVETLTSFDAALQALRDTPGLIIDLRDTPSGGNSTVALGVLGRFIAHRAPYQMHRIPRYGRADVERVWIEQVTPRGPFRYSRPVVVLADHWTGSMGEGMAVGFDALHRATVVGTSLGRLNGSIETVPLERTHVSFNLPEEQLFHVNGTPRHAWNPPVLVDLVATRGQQDPELAAAEHVLTQQLAKASPRH